MGFDFADIRNIPPDERERLRKEISDAEWAQFGRRVHDLMMSELFVVACTQSLLGAANDATDQMRGQQQPTPGKNIARRIRVYLTTGALAK